MGWGWLGGAPTHVHMHAHGPCTHFKHDNFMQMAAPLGEFLGIPYDVICMCMCVYCVCIMFVYYLHQSIHVHVF